jgi:hypothetical protein
MNISKPCSTWRLLCRKLIIASDTAIFHHYTLAAPPFVVTQKMLSYEKYSTRLAGYWPFPFHTANENVIIPKFYFSPKIVRTIKSRRVRWAGHVAHVWELKRTYKIVI